VAVSAATAIFVALALMVSASALMVSASALASAAVATASATVKMVEHSLQFLFCSLAVFDDVALEVELVASERMVEVNLHLVASYFKNSSDEEVAVLILQWNLCAFEDVLAVEVSVNNKHFLVEVDNALRLIFAESLVLVEFKVEFCATLKVLELLLKSVESGTEACDKHERLILRGFFYEFALSVVVDGEELIVSCDELVCLIFHFYFCLLLF